MLLAGATNKSKWRGPQADPMANRLDMPRPGAERSVPTGTAPATARKVRAAWRPTRRSTASSSTAAVSSRGTDGT